MLEGKFLNVIAKDQYKRARKSPPDAPGTPKPCRNSKKSKGASFKDDLEALQERDPEFYQYLKDTDSGLLDFELDDSDGDAPEAPATIKESQSEDEDRTRPQESDDRDEEQQQDQQILTHELLSSWCTEASQHASLRAMRKLLKAFRLACHYGDSEVEVHETLTATSSSVFNKLLIFMLKEAVGIFRKLLGIQDDTDIAAGSFRQLKRWHKVEPLLKSYLGNALHLLGHAMSSGMLIFILRKLRPSIPFLANFQRLQRKYMRQAIRIFSTNEAAPRVQALLFIRQMATTLPGPAMDQAVKGIYRAFVRNAKFMTPASAPHVAFLGSCVVEMFGLDMSVAYEHAFTYIRQLAAVLRSALSNKTTDAFREVYCWQTINTLELWAKLLAAHNDKEELRLLVYPLCQVLLGAVRLVPTARYFPLHLRLIRALIDLGGSTRSLVPATALLLDMLHWSALCKPIKPTAGQPPQNMLLLRASKATLATSSFQADLVEQVMELLATHLAQWACSAAFPELAHCVLQELRRFAKNTTVERFRLAAKALISALEESGCLVSACRTSAGFAPKDTAAVQVFMSKEDAGQDTPLHRYAKLLSLKARQQQALRRTGLVETDKAAGPDEGEEANSSMDEEEDVKSGHLSLHEAQERRRIRKPSMIEEPIKELTMRMTEFGDEEDKLNEYELSD
ncbi:Nucleolar complex protein 2 homolog [Coccomyxa sp. Obi]|nr:Nucleolar complex protein 2 homolog [Coccomyxa sp. Obi]